MYEIEYVRNGNWQKSYAYVSAACARDAQEALKRHDRTIDSILGVVKVEHGVVIVLHK